MNPGNKLALTSNVFVFLKGTAAVGTWLKLDTGA